MKEYRPAIPLPIKRAVRKRCGFGCVVCGIPLYEYDHIVEYSVVKEHTLDNLTLLCDKHHKEKTNGLLPLEKVIKANKNPYNLHSEASSVYDLHFSGNIAKIFIGNNFFVTKRIGKITEMKPIIVDGKTLIGFTIEEDNLFLNLELYDESNNAILIISENELIYSVTQFDIEFLGNRLIIREANRKIILEIIFETPNTVKILQGHFKYNGVYIIVRKESAFLVNNRRLMMGNTYIGCETGIIVGKYSNEPSLAKYPDVSREIKDLQGDLKYEKERLAYWRGVNNQ